MAINEWKIWKKMGIVKEKKEFINIDKSITTILTFIKETRPAVDKLDRLLSEFKLLRKKELKLKGEKKGKNLIRANLQKQIRKYDQILRSYEMFELDQGADLINTRQQIRSYNNSANSAIKIGRIKAKGSMLSAMAGAANTWNT